MTRSSWTPPAAGRALPPRSRSEAPSDADGELRLSRRLDWRFLLPEPQLGRCGYFGRPDPELERALSRCAESLDVWVGPDRPRGPRAPYDVVVVRRPARRGVREAARYVKPGGFLYIEIERTGIIDRWLALAGWPPGAAVSHLARALTRAGFERPASYWHWPDFARCTIVMPLTDPRACTQVLGKRQGSRARRATSWLAVHLLARVGCLPRAIGCASLVARRSPAARPEDE